MTRQQAKRLAFWRGAFPMIFACTVFMLAGALADCITR